MDRLDLPFAHFSTTKDGSNAISFAWDLDIQLDEDHPLKFFSLIVFNDGPVDNPQIIRELSARIIDSIRYQQAILEGNRVSITTEDFFEQCLKKINGEISLFLKEISAPLPIHSWSMVIGMLGRESESKRLQFFTSRFGKVTGWLLNNAQLETKKLISIFDVPDLLPAHQVPQKFFKNVLASELPHNDQLFFCTPNLLNYISLSEIKHVLSTLSVAAAVKHYENQVNFTTNDRLVCGVTVKLSPYTITTQQPTLDLPSHSVEDSINTLLETQNETQRLLGNQAGSPLSALSASINQVRDSVVDRLRPKHESKLVPNASTARDEGFLIRSIQGTVRSIQRVVKSTSGAIEKRSIQQQTKKSSPLDMVSKNQSLLKVNNWKKTVEKLTTPLKQAGDFVKKTNLLKQPIFWAVVAIIAVGIAGMSLFQRSVTQQQENKDAYIATLDTVQTNINTIDSHLIVGREGDATELVTTSEELLSALAETEDEDLLARKSILQEEIEDRQRKLRKEIIVTTESALFTSSFAESLQFPPQQLAQQGNSLYIASEQANVLVNGEITENGITWTETSLQSDLITYSDAIFSGVNQLTFISENTVANANITNGAATSVIANTQSQLTGGQVYNNRIYSLSTSDNQILRSGSGSFSVFSNWLNDVGPGVTDAVDLAIDGTIYVLKPNDLVQYLSGRPSNPGIKLDAVTPALENARELSIATTGNDIFIAEPDRILHFKKTGKFISQYLIDGNPELIDILYNEERAELYILTKEAVIAIKI